MSASPSLQTPEYYMQEALKLARLSLFCGEVPVGALVVDGKGEIVGRGYNAMEHFGTQTAHAEIRALNQAKKKRGDWRLDDCTLYVTLEPCMMCLGLVLLSRVREVAFGAYSPQFGAIKMTKYLPDGYKTDTIIRSGTCQEQCSDVLQHFFRQVRQKPKGSFVENRELFLEQMRERLVERRDELLAILTPHIAYDEPDTDVKDSGDEATQASMEKLVGSLQQTEVEELHRIDDALQRISLGEYGFCIDCESAISQKRLEYSPYAERCIACQEAIEYQE